jgi:hypothetical protein
MIVLVPSLLPAAPGYGAGDLVLGFEMMMTTSCTLATLAFLSAELLLISLASTGTVPDTLLQSVGMTAADTNRQNRTPHSWQRDILMVCQLNSVMIKVCWCGFDGHELIQ